MFRNVRKRKKKQSEEKKKTREYLLNLFGKGKEKKEKRRDNLQLSPPVPLTLNFRGGGGGCSLSGKRGGKNVGDGQRRKYLYNLGRSVLRNFVESKKAKAREGGKCRGKKRGVLPACFSKGGEKTVA